jgi:integrase
LSHVFKKAVQTGYRFGTILQLLVLTGQRRSEIGLLRWDWIDEKNRTITFPASVTKNNRVHSFPYGDMVADILATIPRSGEYTFRAIREHAKGTPVLTVNGWSNSKAAFDRLVQGKAAKSPVAPWTLHDLRRTFATNLAGLGVPPHITERLLNHVSGAISGVAAIYNRHAYADEMRQAIKLWEARLHEILALHRTA